MTSEWLPAPPATDAADLRPHSVYRCFNDAGDLLYVGCAHDVEERMDHQLHPCNAGKMPNGILRRHLCNYTVEEHPTKAAARDAERKAIRDEAPLLNWQHNPRRFRRVTGGDYAPVEPVHPLTAELCRFAYGPPATLEEMRGALQTLCDLLFPQALTPSPDTG